MDIQTKTKMRMMISDQPRNAQVAYMDMLSKLSDEEVTAKLAVWMPKRLELLGKEIQRLSLDQIRVQNAINEYTTQKETLEAA